MLGDLEITWKDASRLYSMELRTSRDEWSRALGPKHHGHIETGFITLELDYDTNDIAVVEANPSVVWDPTHGRIAFRFADDAAGVRWIAIADSVLVGLDSDGCLVEIRFEDCQIDAPQTKVN
jgi:hypothetical protein